ncbi:MAG: CoA-binding protein [Chloroflexi bacterium]|nr:CoA-binding protein [Chloroflexota bacterium]
MSWDPGFEAAFHPKAIAIVGASGSAAAAEQRGGHGGTMFVRTLKQLGYPGHIYPINPKGQDVLGCKAYPTISAVPEHVDLVIVSASARHVPAILEDAAKAGARNVHLYCSGFTESGGETGRQLDNKLKEIARREGLRVLGPNCMGLHVPAARMSTWDFMPAESGPVAFISQSGGHASFITRYGREFGIKFSKVVSYGNATVMDCTDFLEYFAHDPETRIIGQYIEGIKDGRKLTQMVREINRTKPVLVWKGGVTEAGARAISTHTGSLAGNKQVWEAFYKQTGAVRVSSADEVADMVITFLHMKPPQGRRVAIIGGGGGNTVSATDNCAREGLEVPVLTLETQKELSKFVPPAGTSVRNPLDMGIVLRDVDLFLRTMELVNADPTIDVVIVDIFLDLVKEAGEEKIDEMGRMMCELARRGKPMAATLYTFGGDPAIRAERAKLNKMLPEAGIPIYRSLPRAARAIAKFMDYHDFQRDLTKWEGIS